MKLERYSLVQIRDSNTSLSITKIKFEGRFSREIRSKNHFESESIIVRNEEKAAYLRLTRVTTDTPRLSCTFFFDSYSVNSTSWPHKSTTQWRVARESIFIVAKCIKLRYRQSLSYSCTRACTRARARLQSTFVARFPYVCACVCVYVRCAVCTRCGQLTLNVSTWTGWIMGLSINLIAINTYEKRAKERPKCVCNPCVYPHSCIS